MEQKKIAIKEIIKNITFLSDRFKKELEINILPLLDEYFVYLHIATRTKDQSNSLSLRIEIIEPYSLSEQTIETLNEDTCYSIILNENNEYQFVLLQPSQFNHFLSKYIFKPSKQIKEMLIKLQPTEQSLKNFKKQCEKENIDCTKFNQWNIKYKEYYQSIFDQWIETAKSNGRWNKQLVKQFLIDHQIYTIQNQNKLESFVPLVNENIHESFEESSEDDLKPNVNNKKHYQKGETYMMYNEKSFIPGTTKSNSKLSQIKLATYVWMLHDDDGIEFLLKEKESIQNIISMSFELYKNHLILMNILVETLENYNSLSVEYLTELEKCQWNKEDKECVENLLKRKDYHNENFIIEGDLKKKYQQKLKDLKK